METGKKRAKKSPASPPLGEAEGQRGQWFAILLLILVLSLVCSSYGADTTAPRPVPAKWRIVPITLGPNSIQMASVTALDQANSVPIEYLFECSSVPSASSTWQTDTNYVATGLTPSTVYTFKLRARDSALNMTSWSLVRSATTDAVTTPPVLRLDLNYTPDNNEPNTQVSFTKFSIANSGSEINGVTIDLGGTITSTRRDDPCGGWSRYAGSPLMPGDPCYYAQRAGERIYRDFVFGVNPSGVTITLWGLGINRDCNITIWAYDSQVTDANRVAEWYANGTYIFDTNFIGGPNSRPLQDNYSLSASNDFWKWAFSGRVTADDFGRIILTSERAPSSPTGQPFAFVNALQVEPIGDFVPTRYAHRPVPFDGTENVLVNGVLSWRPGVDANKHDVYLGTDWDDVNDASRINPLGVLVSQDQEPNTFDPYGITGFLKLDHTYYWRVDENSPPNVYKGEVWSFRTLAYSVVDNFNHVYDVFYPDRINDTWKDYWTQGAPRTKSQVYNMSDPNHDGTTYQSMSDESYDDASLFMLTSSIRGTAEAACRPYNKLSEEEKNRIDGTGNYSAADYQQDSYSLDTLSGIFAGSAEGIVYQYYGGTDWLIVSPDLGGSVLCLVEYQNAIYAGTRDGKVWKTVFSPGTGYIWTEVMFPSGQEPGQVNALIEYKGELYAGTGYGSAKLFRLHGNDQWEFVTTANGFAGIRCLYVYQDILFLGDIAEDRFGHYYEGVYTYDGMYGISCIWDFQEYNNRLYAGSYLGDVYRLQELLPNPLTSFTWGKVREADNYDTWELETFQGLLYVSHCGELLTYDGDTFSESTIVIPNGNTIIAMLTCKDGWGNLLIGVGQEMGAGEGCTGTVGRIYLYNGTELISISGEIGMGIQCFLDTRNLIQLTQSDDVNDGDCVGPGDEINYRIDYNYPMESNIGDIYDVNIVDELPEEVRFISADSNGTYDRCSHTIRWNLGTLEPGESGFVTLKVQVKCAGCDWTGSIIKNCCAIKSVGQTLGIACESTPKCYASDPSPRCGTDVSKDVVLGWRPGPKAVTHDVYLGIDRSKVASANRSNPLGVLVSQGQDSNTYDPCGLLEKNQCYYWRIDEVNDSNIWRGGVWHFRTGADDITLVGDGPQYSMGYWYRNNLTPYFSEVRADIGTGDAQLPIDKNWLGMNAKSLTMWFYGISTNAVTEKMYVTLTDGTNTAKVLYKGDMNDIRAEEWQEWDIDLQYFADQDVNLSNVAKIYIGFGDATNPAPATGSGTVYFDDIRLYNRRCVPELFEGDLDCDCVVNFRDFAILANEWLETGCCEADLYEDNKVDFNDLAILVDNWLEKG
ncbi:MAG: hypothetical protein PHQ35_00480 [Phycisphaerae bacterium]|nr:hypothetical protein [Phycisphaerae bacterium]MDD5381456.1 hypothetical protein [Phycisphaerae bacterium]